MMIFVALFINWIIFILLQINVFKGPWCWNELKRSSSSSWSCRKTALLLTYLCSIANRIIFLPSQVNHCSTLISNLSPTKQATSKCYLLHSGSLPWTDWGIHSDWQLLDCIWLDSLCSSQYTPRPLCLLISSNFAIHFVPYFRYRHTLSCQLAMAFY